MRFERVARGVDDDDDVLYRGSVHARVERP